MTSPECQCCHCTAERAKREHAKLVHPHLEQLLKQLGEDACRRITESEDSRRRARDQLGRRLSALFAEFLRQFEIPCTLPAAEDCQAEPGRRGPETEP